jgi:DNA-binding CsgD family transcriptional regulator
MNGDLSRVLVNLYRAAAVGMSSSRFKDLAFASVSEVLPFESAGWGTFAVTPSGPKVHSVHVYQLPLQMMLDYEAVKQFDTLSAKAQSKPGRTINVSIDNTRWKLHPAIVAHVRKWGLDHSLGTIHVDPQLNICHAISLYRGAGSRPFEANERAQKQQLMTHMVEAWNMTALRYMEQPDEARQQTARALAVVDREGMIYNAHAGLYELMGQEFPNWAGPLLPMEVRRNVCAVEPRVYRGERVSCNQVRLSGDGMILVCVRPVSAVDRLSARETMAATLFAGGKSHKEIAIQMQISPTTVRNQLQSVYHKLGVGNKIELARMLKALA